MHATDTVYAHTKTHTISFCVSSAIFQTVATETVCRAALVINQLKMVVNEVENPNH